LFPPAWQAEQFALKIRSPFSISAAIAILGARQETATLTKMRFRFSEFMISPEG
jgi:hypothetical protein